MFGLGPRPAPAGEISLRQALPDMPDDAIEIARFWVNDNRSYVAVAFQKAWNPELLGALLVESIHTAASAHAAPTDLSPEEALQEMWRGLDEERIRLQRGSTGELN